MKNKNKVKVYANIGLLLVALIWGSGFVVSKILLDYIGPYYLLFYRFLISFLVMALIFSGKFSLINKENFKAGLVLGVLMFGGFMTQMVGLEFMDAGKQGFITASNVVMVPFIFWGISKVKPDAYDIIGALMCFWNGFLSLEGSVASLGRGEILTLCSAVFFAFHVSFIGFYAKDHDPILLTLYQMFFFLYTGLDICHIQGRADKFNTKTCYTSGYILGTFQYLCGFYPTECISKVYKFNQCSYNLEPGGGV